MSTIFTLKGYKYQVRCENELFSKRTQLKHIEKRLSSLLTARKHSSIPQYQSAKEVVELLMATIEENMSATGKTYNVLRYPREELSSAGGQFRFQKRIRPRLPLESFEVLLGSRQPR